MSAGYDPGFSCRDGDQSSAYSGSGSTAPWRTAALLWTHGRFWPNSIGQAQ